MSKRAASKPTPPSTDPRWLRLLKGITRDTILFVSGLLLAINEAVLRNGQERPVLIALYAGMMGLPFVLRGDEMRQKGKDK